jgi:hypothetical protein
VIYFAIYIQSQIFKTAEQFRPVTFRPANALNQLKRSSRDLGPLAEHGEGFAVQSQRVKRAVRRGSSSLTSYFQPLHA